MAATAHPRPNYVAIWAWLMGLLFVSLLAVYLPFSQPVTVTLIFLIALAKAILVAVHFMHMRFERWLIHAIVITPLLLFIIMTLSLIPDIVYNK
jgi:caa(3)-type oxidase subunit IV